MRKIPVPIAPPNEQKRIVAEIEKQFSRLDEAVENLKRVKANLKRYKASVLKFAVEGKLTEDWRKERPVELESVNFRLKQITKEREKEYKRKLSEWENAVKKWKSAGKEGKKPVKPRKPIEFSDVTKKEIINLPILPDNWTWVRLGNLCADIFDGPFGSNLKSKDYVDSGIRVVRLENVGELNFLNEKQAFITKEKYNLLKKHTVGPDDIIFSSFIAGGTRVVVLPDHIDKAINKADCFCIRIYGKTILNHYLACFLSTGAAYYQFENLVHGATRPRINTSQLKNCAISLPPIIEQKEISNLIAQHFSIIEKLEVELLENLERAELLRQGILKKAFSGKLVPQDQIDEPAGKLLELIKADREKQEDELGKKRKKRKKAMTTKEKPKEKRDILEVLKGAEEAMRPEDLFRIAGYKSKDVEEFYAALKVADQQKTISQIKKKNGEVFLRAL